MVYLDIKFWIILRDVLVGLRNAPVEKQLLSELREGVERGSLFCPISDASFGELLKNANVESRRITAKLIDQLSLGVTLIPYDLRVATELAHLLHFAKTPNQVHPLKHLVWAKLSYVMGFSHPSGTPFDAVTELAMQKEFFDHMWNIPMEQIIDAIGDTPLPADPFHALSHKINELNAQHREELNSFIQTYDSELHGMIGVFINLAVDIVHQMVVAENGPRPRLSLEQWTEQARQLHNLLFAASKKDGLKDSLSTLKIHASLNASVRWNKGQKLKPNDFLDFQHAAAALGYCDAFFTERSLRGLTTAAHVALDKKYDCHVVATPEDALAYLYTLKEGTNCSL